MHVPKLIGDACNDIVTQAINWRWVTRPVLLHVPWPEMMVPQLLNAIEISRLILGVRVVNQTNRVVFLSLGLVELNVDWLYGHLALGTAHVSRMLVFECVFDKLVNMLMFSLVVIKNLLK